MKTIPLVRVGVVEVMPAETSARVNLMLLRLIITSLNLVLPDFSPTNRAHTIPIYSLFISYLPRLNHTDVQHGHSLSHVLDVECLFFTWSPYCLLVVCCFVLTGVCDQVGFSFTKLNWNTPLKVFMIKIKGFEDGEKKWSCGIKVSVSWDIIDVIIVITIIKLLWVRSYYCIYK